MFIGNKKYFIITRDKEKNISGNPPYFAQLIRQEFNDNINFDIYRDRNRDRKDMLSQVARKIKLPQGGLICKTDVRSLKSIDFDPHGSCIFMSKNILDIFKKYLTNQYYQYTHLKIIQQTSHKEVTEKPMFLFRYCYCFYLLEKSCDFYDYFLRSDGYIGYTIKKERVAGRIAPKPNQNHVSFDLSSVLPDIIKVSMLPSDLSLWISEEVKKEVESLDLPTVKFIDITPEFYSSIYLRNSNFPNYFKEIDEAINDQEKIKKDAKSHYFKRK